jgi:hypothetical protein
MIPEQFRSLFLKPGAKIGVLGDLTASRIVQGSLKTYVILEREHNDKTIAWDTAILMVLPQAIQVTGIAEKEFFGNELLLIHRYPGFAWDNGDPTVHVFGVTNSEISNSGPLNYVSWQPHVIWLDARATMFVDEPPNPSALSKRLTLE